MGIFTKSFIRTVKEIATREKYFFEFPGQPGRIYVEDFNFGLDIAANSARISLVSPVTLYPDPFDRNWRTLYYFLQERVTHGELEMPLLPECLIKVETLENGRTVTKTKYRLIQVEILRANVKAKDGVVGYKFKFQLGMEVRQ